MVVLDWMLPGRDGIEVLKTLRAEGRRTPVLLLTARDTIEDRVLGLDSGADDYLVKPFAFAELLARIRALLRRTGREEPLRCHVADLTLDLQTREVTRSGRILALTPREFDLLAYLLRQHGQPVTRQALARDVWRETHRSTPLDNVIDVHVAHLRRKVDGRFVFVTLNTDGAVAIVSAAERKVVKTVAVGRGPHIVMLRPDGKRLYVTSEGDMKLVEMDAATWEVTGGTPVFAWPRVLAQSKDGRKVYQTIRWLNGALVIDPEKKQVVDRIALGEPKFASDGKDAHGIGVTPDGKELWIVTQTTDDATVLSTKDHRVLGEVHVGRDPNWLEFTPDGKLAVISNTGSGDVSMVDVAQRRTVKTVKVGKAPKRLTVGMVEVAP